jgi:methylated-DNA-[protein]-cysteine S-methyltransferase
VETAVYHSPFGPIELGVSAGRLARVELCVSNGRPAVSTASALPYLQALDRYFAGEASALIPDALDLSGCTQFQRRVLRELSAVGFGELVTYGELAERVGLAQGARAVGGAVGSNPLPIFIPCHRVVAAGGGLGGFSGDLLWKERLLAHEGWHVAEGKVL